MINFKIPKIDSLRLLIPISDLKIIDSKLLKTFVTVCEETAEIDSEHIKTNVFHTENGIKTRFAVQNLFNENKDLTQYLAIGISSKMLKENYFFGISKSTIQSVFNYINSTGTIEVSKEVFLNAKVVDVDFCIDLKLKDNTCKDVFKLCYDLTIPNKQVTVNLFNEGTNRGIQWGNREKVHKAYTTKQFLKYYAKILELKNNSTDFYNAYLKDRINEKTLFSDGEEYITDENTEENVLRIETTIKNKDHFATYGIYCKTLIDLLNIDLPKYGAIFNRPIQTYMTGYKTVNHTTELTLQERMYIHTLKLEAKLMGLKPHQAIDKLVLNMYPNFTETKINTLKVQRSKFKKRLNELLDIDKRIMIENKNNNIQKSLTEVLDFGLVPN